MSREMYRVPIDFDWPLNQRWKGYVNPHDTPCPAGCISGYTHGYWAVEHLIRLMAMTAEDAYALPRSCVVKNGSPHPWVRDAGFDRLSPEFGEFVLRLCGERKPKKDAGTSFFNDFTEEYRRKLFKAFRKNAKLGKNWGKCKTCKGHGVDPTIWPTYKAWKKFDPPEGPGYQVWEQVSEGSPISPVFATPEEVVVWLVGQGHSEAGARAFVGSGWAPSAMGVVGSPIMNGIDGLTAFGGK